MKPSTTNQMALNTDLSDLFRTLAALMDIKGESTFKAIAFSKVSRILKDMTIDLEEYTREGKLKDLEGIGPSSQRIIEQFITTGKSKDFDEVAASVPAGLIPMLEIPGLGPKTIALLWKERKITSIEELIKAIAAGKLDGLKGIGDKKIEAIKQGIEHCRNRPAAWGSSKRWRSVNRCSNRSNGCPMSSSPKSPEASADVARRSAISISSAPQKPHRRRSRISRVRKTSPGAARSRPGPDQGQHRHQTRMCRLISASSPPTISAPPSNISPDQKNTTPKSADLLSERK